MKRETHALRPDLHVRSEPALGSLTDSVESPGGITEVFEDDVHMPSGSLQVASAVEPDSLLGKLL
jgi:hypothetical protein